MSLPGATDGLRHALLPALAGLLLFCRPASPPPPPPAPEVEYSHCWAVHLLPGPVCTLQPDRQLSLWVKLDPGMEPEIQAAGQPLVPTDQEEVHGGRRLKLTLPARASSLTVRLRPPDGSSGPPWSLALAEPDRPAWLGKIKKLDAEAGQRLASLRKTAPPGEQGFVLRLLALRARNEDTQAAEEAYLQQGIAVDRAEKCLSCEVEKVSWLADLYLGQGRFGEARRSLEGLRLPSQAPAGSKHLVAYYRGLLSEAVGDYSSALEQLRSAADLAERVGIDRYRWEAEQVLARLLQDLGRSEESSKLFRRLREIPGDVEPCDVGDLWTNEAWSRLLAHEGDETVDDPTPELQKAQKIYEDNGCRAEQRLNARLNLALAHLQAGRLREARKALDEARPLASEATLRERLWRDDLEARTAIVEGNPELALRLYDGLDRNAERFLSFEGRFRAAFGRARARRALGQRAAALDALAEADRRIDEQSRHVPVHEGRDTLVAQREVATRLYLKLLLADGDRRRAFALARRARSRLLRQIAIRDRLSQLTPEEQRKWDEAMARYRALRDAVDREAAQEWQLPEDQAERARERRAGQLAQAQVDLDRAVALLGGPGDREESSLPPPLPGEVVLAYYPMSSRKWVGFAAHGQEVESATFELPAGALDDPKAPEARESLARKLLAPFRRAIAGAERVRVLPYGDLRKVDFHLLPFDGEPLLARHVVIYSLDLPARRPSPPPAGGVALLVADPQGNLPEARQEAASVAGAVRAWGPGWTLRRLDGTAARAGEVRRALSGAGLFHYAGHGRFAGFAGWDSELPLADGSRLALGDLLTLHPAPRWVVLSSCDAGRSSQEAPGEGIGLANAFLLAGSQEVIAAMRPVADRAARDLLAELYRGWRPGADLPRQLQRAQLACLQNDPEADCASFRLLEP